MAHDNEQALRAAYEAFGSGDIEKVAAFIAEGSVWHVRSLGVLDGDYAGRDQVLGFLGRLMEETGGTFRVDVHDVLASDRHAAALNKVTASRGGRTVEAHQTAVYQMADGQSVEAWFHYDEAAAVHDLFS